jgi:hypothetical protein
MMMPSGGLLSGAQVPAYRCGSPDVPGKNNPSDGYRAAGTFSLLDE